jgi:hypothetical protein
MHDLDRQQLEHYEQEGLLSEYAIGELTEAQEMQLASQFLEITSEEELEAFLGNLFKGVAQNVGGVIRSPEGKALGGVLKGVARTALPVVGGALGSFVAPGVGTAIGSKLGSFASGLFEMELQGMTHEQAQMETARRYVRLAAASAASAATAPPDAPPAKVARDAITQGARRHAPGLLRGRSAGGGSQSRRQRRRGPGEQPRRRRGRPLGAAAFPGGNAVSGNGAGEPSHGAPGWEEPELHSEETSPGYGGGRPQGGRWIRRGTSIVVHGV